MKKRIIVEVSPEEHTELKIKCASNGESIKDYILRLIKADKK
jgi:hypothetical protein